MINLPFVHIRLGNDPTLDIDLALEKWNKLAGEVLSDLNDDDRHLVLQMVTNQSHLMLQLYTPGCKEVYATIKTPIIHCKFVMQPN